MRRLLFGLTLCALTAQASFAQSIAPEVFRALQTAQAAQQSGNFAQAEQALKSVTAKPESLEQALLWRSAGYLAWAQGNTQQALNMLEQALRSDQLTPEQVAEDRLNLAKLSFSLKNYQHVHAYLQGVAVTDEILELQIQAWQNLGRLDKALPLAERYLQGKSTISESWLQFMVAANAEVKHYAAAQQWQKRILQRNPNQLRAWQQLAALQQMAGNYAQALATLRTAYSKGITFQAADLDRLIALAAASEQPWQAARLLAGMLQHGILPASLSSQERLAQLHWQAREYQAAAQQYAELAQQSGKGQHWLSLAQLEIQQSRWDAGLQALKRAEQAGADQQQIAAWRDWAQSRIALHQQLAEKSS